MYRPHNEEMERNLALAVAQHDLFIEALERRHEEAVARLVFEHWEPARENMEMDVAPRCMTAEHFAT